MPVHSKGQVVILNGAPRAGKSSIASAIQARFEGVWMNLSVDAFKAMTPDRYQPGIGFRPGGERPDLESLIVLLYRAVYESIAAHSRLGLNVVVDADHHDWYSSPCGILPRCARLLHSLPVLFVGVRCPLDVVMERRRATWSDQRWPPCSTMAVGAKRSGSTPSSRPACFQVAAAMPGAQVVGDPDRLRQLPRRERA